MRSAVSPVATQDDRSRPKPSSARNASSKRAIIGATAERSSSASRIASSAPWMRACGSRSARSRHNAARWVTPCTACAALEKSGGAQVRPLDRVVAEMVVEPRPPGGAQRISRLQHPAQPRAGAAANEPEMAAALMRHQFENDAGLAVALDAEHDAFVGPLHGRYVASFRGRAKRGARQRRHSLGNSSPISR